MIPVIGCGNRTGPGLCEGCRAEVAEDDVFCRSCGRAADGDNVINLSARRPHRSELELGGDWGAVRSDIQGAGAIVALVAKAWRRLRAACGVKP